MKRLFSELKLIGRKFGKLRVLSISRTRSTRESLYWLCICDCGHLTCVRTGELKAGNIKSCGCGRLRGSQTMTKYSTEWTLGLREQIRNRDKRKCQFPGCDYCDDLECNKKLHVHHIDGIKSNCNPKNLVSLCGTHHTSIGNQFRSWQHYFQSYTESFEICFAIDSRIQSPTAT